MKKIHIGALVCFSLAVVSYLLAWLPGAVALAAIGVLVEIVGWFLLLSQTGGRPLLAKGSGSTKET